MKDRKFFPYSGLLSGIFAPEAKDPRDQEDLNRRLEYPVLTGNYRETNNLIAQGAEPNADLLMHAVMQKWTRFSHLFLTHGVKPTEEMATVAIKQADHDTLGLLIDHKCPVSDESRVWASVYGSGKVREALVRAAPGNTAKKDQPTPV